MKRLLIIICAIISVSAFNCQTPPDKSVTQLSPTEFEVFLDDKIQLVDVRTSDEFNLEHIDHAQNIDFFDENFSNTIDKLDKDAPVFIYCRSGKRSGQSIVEFKKVGFTKIYELKGGILNWKSEGLEIIKE